VEEGTQAGVVAGAVEVEFVAPQPAASKTSKLEAAVSKYVDFIDNSSMISITDKSYACRLSPHLKTGRLISVMRHGRPSAKPHN
jgi:hypothetical protein